MRIIREKQRIEHVRYDRAFEWVDRPGAGFGFTCDEQGNPTEPASDNLRRCLDGTFAVRDCGVRVTRWSHVEPAVGLCSCGAEVELESFTNTCDRCDRDYNWAGQELSPRECWGEETGEDPADVANVR